MGPKKKQAKKEKGKGAEPDEHAAPSIYKLLCTQPVSELEADLTAPDSHLLKENVEFDILVDRLQNTCLKLARDNDRIHKFKTKIEGKVATERQRFEDLKRDQLAQREEIKETKTDKVTHLEGERDAITTLREDQA